MSRDFVSGVRTISLGCRLNAHESVGMEELALGAGFERAVIVNTCAVTGEAARQSRQAVRRAAREDRQAILLVTGCAAQLDSQAFGELEGVDAVIDNGVKLDRQVWEGLGRSFPGGRLGGSAGVGRSVRSRATVQIQNGCDHACTFCIIPQGRGISRSVCMEEVTGAVSALRDRTEVVLTGVDLTSWGQDLPGRRRLGDLVEAVLESAPELPCLRLSSVDVAEIDGKLEGLLCKEERLAPYLHLSLQSGDDMILKRMKRRHSSEQAIDFCRRLRKARPGFAFGADLIAGFPTETPEMFENTLETVNLCALDYLHVFPFSARPGTPAARMPPVPVELVRERAARLRKEGRRCLIGRLAFHVGKTERAIIEGGSRARLPDFAPVSLLGCRAGVEAGFVPVRLLGHDGRRLIGELA